MKQNKIIKKILPILLLLSLIFPILFVASCYEYLGNEDDPNYKKKQQTEQEKDDIDDIVEPQVAEYRLMHFSLYQQGEDLKGEGTKCAKIVLLNKETLGEYITRTTGEGATEEEKKATNSFVSLINSLEKPAQSIVTYIYQYVERQEDTESEAESEEEEVEDEEEESEEAEPATKKASSRTVNLNTEYKLDSFEKLKSAYILADCNVKITISPATFTFSKEYGGKDLNNHYYYIDLVNDIEVKAVLNNGKAINPTYQWYEMDINKTNTAEGKAIEGETSSKYLPDPDKKYFVKATYGGTTITSNVTTVDNRKTAPTPALIPMLNETRIAKVKDDKGKNVDVTYNYVKNAEWEEEVVWKVSVISTIQTSAISYQWKFKEEGAKDWTNMPDTSENWTLNLNKIETLQLKEGKTYLFSVNVNNAEKGMVPSDTDTDALPIKVKICPIPLKLIPQVDGEDLQSGSKIRFFIPNSVNEEKPAEHAFSMKSSIPISGSYTWYISYGRMEGQNIENQYKEIDYILLNPLTVAKEKTIDLTPPTSGSEGTTQASRGARTETGTTTPTTPTTPPTPPKIMGFRDGYEYYIYAEANRKEGDAVVETCNTKNNPIIISVTVEAEPGAESDTEIKVNIKFNSTFEEGQAPNITQKKIGKPGEGSVLKNLIDGSIDNMEVILNKGGGRNLISLNSTKYSLQEIGYEFLGWYEKTLSSMDTFGNVTFRESKKNEITYAENIKKSVKEVTLFAKWRRWEETIKFDKNVIDESTVRGSMNSVKVLYGDKITLPASTFLLTDNQFTGWSKNPLSESPTILDKGQYIWNDPKATGDTVTTLYAIWSSMPYAFILDAPLEESPDADVNILYDNKQEVFVASPNSWILSEDATLSYYWYVDGRKLTPNEQRTENSTKLSIYELRNFATETEGTRYDVGKSSTHTLMIQVVMRYEDRIKTVSNTKVINLTLEPLPKPEPPKDETSN